LADMRVPPPDFSLSLAYFSCHLPLLPPFLGGPRFRSTFGPLDSHTIPLLRTWISTLACPDRPFSIEYRFLGLAPSQNFILFPFSFLLLRVLRFPFSFFSPHSSQEMKEMSSNGLTFKSPGELSFVLVFSFLSPQPVSVFRVQLEMGSWVFRFTSSMTSHFVTIPWPALFQKTDFNALRPGRSSIFPLK